MTANRSKRLPAKVAPELLVPGAPFDTPFEQGCTVTESTAYARWSEGYFLANDSEGVECEYSLEMVERVGLDE